MSAVNVLYGTEDPDSGAPPIEVQKKILRSIGIIRDFPKAGIIFRDITTLLADKHALRYSIDLLCARYRGHNIDYFIGIESRGFVFATALACILNAGTVLLRKPGKLPGALVTQKYDLEYGQAELCMQVGAVPKGSRVVIVDDLLATGGTLAAACNLIRKSDANIIEACVIIELIDLNGRSTIEPSTKVFTLATCHEVDHPEGGI